MRKHFAFLIAALCLLTPAIGHARDNDSRHNNGNSQRHDRGNDRRGNSYGHHYDRSRDHYRPLRPYYYRPQERVVILNSPNYYRETIVVNRGYSPPYSYDDRSYFVSDRYSVGSYAPRHVHWQPVPSWYRERLPRGTLW